MFNQKVTLDTLISAINQNSHDTETISFLFSKLDEADLQYAQDFQDRVKDAQLDDHLFQNWAATKTALLKLIAWNEENDGAERGKSLQQIMKDTVCAIEIEKDNDDLKSKKSHLFTGYLNRMDALLTEWRNRNEEELE